MQKTDSLDPSSDKKTFKKRSLRPWSSNLLGNPPVASEMAGSEELPSSSSFYAETAALLPLPEIEIQHLLEQRTREIEESMNSSLQNQVLIGGFLLPQNIVANSNLRSVEEETLEITKNLRAENADELIKKLESSIKMEEEARQEAEGKALLSLQQATQTVEQVYHLEQSLMQERQLRLEAEEYYKAIEMEFQNTLANLEDKEQMLQKQLILADQAASEKINQIQKETAFRVQEALDLAQQREKSARAEAIMIQEKLNTAEQYTEEKVNEILMQANHRVTEIQEEAQIAKENAMKEAENKVVTYLEKYKQAEEHAYNVEQQLNQQKQLLAEEKQQLAQEKNRQAQLEQSCKALELELQNTLANLEDKEKIFQQQLILADQAASEKINQIQTETAFRIQEAQDLAQQREKSARAEVLMIQEKLNTAEQYTEEKINEILMHANQRVTEIQEEAQIAKENAIKEAENKVVTYLEKYKQAEEHAYNVEQQLNQEKQLLAEEKQQLVQEKHLQAQLEQFCKALELELQTALQTLSAKEQTFQQQLEMTEKSTTERINQIEESAELRIRETTKLAQQRENSTQARLTAIQEKLNNAQQHAEAQMSEILVHANNRIAQVQQECDKKIKEAENVVQQYQEQLGAAQKEADKTHRLIEQLKSSKAAEEESRKNAEDKVLLSIEKARQATEQTYKAEQQLLLERQLKGEFEKSYKTTESKLQNVLLTLEAKEQILKKEFQAKLMAEEKIKQLLDQMNAYQTKIHAETEKIISEKDQSCLNEINRIKTETEERIRVIETKVSEKIAEHQLIADSAIQKNQAEAKERINQIQTYANSQIAKYKAEADSRVKDAQELANYHEQSKHVAQVSFQKQLAAAEKAAEHKIEQLRLAASKKIKEANEAAAIHDKSKIAALESVQQQIEIVEQAAEKRINQILSDTTERLNKIQAEADNRVAQLQIEADARVKEANELALVHERAKQYAEGTIQIQLDTAKIAEEQRINEVKATAAAKVQEANELALRHEKAKQTAQNAIQKHMEAVKQAEIANKELEQKIKSINQSRDEDRADYNKRLKALNEQLRQIESMKTALEIDKDQFDNEMATSLATIRRMETIISHEKNLRIVLDKKLNTIPSIREAEALRKQLEDKYLELSDRVMGIEQERAKLEKALKQAHDTLEQQEALIKSGKFIKESLANQISEYSVKICELEDKRQQETDKKLLIEQKMEVMAREHKQLEQKTTAQINALMAEKQKLEEDKAKKEQEIQDCKDRIRQMEYIEQVDMEPDAV